MSQITWRNINAPTNTGAAALLQGSANTIDKAFGGLQDVVQAEQGIRKANHANQRVNNTQVFMDAMNGYRTVDDFNAAQSGGAIEQLRGSLGPNIDAGAVSAAMEARPGQLMQRQNTEDTFNAGQLRKTLDPLAEQYKGLVLANDDAGAASFLEANKQGFSDGGMYASLSQFGMTQNEKEADDARQLVMQGRQDADDAQSVLDRQRGNDAFTRGEADRISGVNANQMVNSRVTDFMAQDGIRANQYNNFAAMFGMPEKNGEIDWDSVSPEMEQRFLAAANEAGVVGGAPQLTTQASNQLANDLLAADPDMSPEDLNRQITAFNNQIAGRTTLSAPDQAALTKELSDLAVTRGIASNPEYVYMNVEPTQAAMDAMGAAKKLLPPDTEIPPEFATKITEVAQIGVDIGDGKFVKLYGPDIQAALTAAQGEWAWTDLGALEDVLRSYATSPAILERSEKFELFNREAQEIKDGFEQKAGVYSRSENQANTFRRNETESRSRQSTAEAALRAEQQAELDAENAPYELQSLIDSAINGRQGSFYSPNNLPAMQSRRVENARELLSGVVPGQEYGVAMNRRVEAAKRLIDSLEE